MLPNGYLHYAQQYQALTWGGGGYVTHEILDENFKRRGIHPRRKWLQRRMSTILKCCPTAMPW